MSPRQAVRSRRASLRYTVRMRFGKKLGIGLGLVLGWLAAAQVQQFTLLAQQDDAAHETVEEVGGHGQDAPHGDGDISHGTDHGVEHGEAQGHHGKGDEKAAALAPEHDPSWFGALRTGVILLFVLAALVGSAALLMKGPEPPDPADAHDHH
jgi:hypothetical protein